MSNTLEERLRLNSSAFDGLLSLIPAKYYYDDKTQEQWRAKKKSKDQSKIDKKKKLDPEQQDQESASALEVMKQRESNAKPVVLPGAKLQRQAKADSEADSSNEESDAEEDAEENGDKSDQDQKSASKEDAVEDEAKKQAEPAHQGPRTAGHGDESIDVIFDDEGNEVVSNQTEGSEDVPALKAKTPKQQTAEQEKQKKKNLEKLRAKLQEKIQSLKQKRKAPGSQVEGAPSSREAILAQRKKKEELKRKRVEQDKTKADESSEDSNSGSDSDEESTSPLKKQRTDDNEDLTKQLMFQNIEFDDGERATSDLQRLRKTGKKKGPSNNDIKAHLKLAEAKKAKLESKDELEQISMKEKEKWQRAMLQAEGLKIKDDEKLLRKALKRKENRKKKSAFEWRERKEEVATSISDRQKRREENLQIRKDNKGKKRNQKEKMKRGFKGAMGPKKRAGFEGRIKSGKKK